MFKITDDLDRCQRDLEVDIWDILKDEAQEWVSIREEIHFLIVTQNGVELALNVLYGPSSFLIHHYI